MNNLIKLLDERYFAWRKHTEYINQSYLPKQKIYDYKSFFATCSNCGKVCVKLYDDYWHQGTYYEDPENMCYECFEENRIALALEDYFLKEKREKIKKDFNIDLESRLQKKIEETKKATSSCCICGRKCNYQLQNIYANNYKSIFPQKNIDLDRYLCRNLMCHIRLYRISTIKPYRDITAKFLIKHICYNRYNQRDLAVALGELIYYIQLKTKRRKKWRK